MGSNRLRVARITTSGGHYLSAVALMYASTGDETLKANGNAVVAELAKCQSALKGGYLSAFPLEFFDRLREREKVWAPFYTLHKIMAGNLDMYLYCGNEQALDMAEKMAGWTARYTQPLSYEHMQRVLGTEYGGMGEVLANLYAVTGKEYYLEVAQRFDKKQFFDPLAAHRDELKGLHVNTHIPQVIAAARYYELTGERRYRDIAEYFWDEVVSERSLLYRRHQQSRILEHRSRKACRGTQHQHHGRLLRLQHDEVDAPPVRLVAGCAPDGLLRARDVQSPPGHDQSRRRHHDVLPATRFGLLEDFWQTV